MFSTLCKPLRKPLRDKRNNAKFRKVMMQSNAKVNKFKQSPDHLTFYVEFRLMKILITGASDFVFVRSTFDLHNLLKR